MFCLMFYWKKLVLVIEHLLWTKPWARCLYIVYIVTNAENIPAKKLARAHARHSVVSDYSSPGSSVCERSQARVLEWVDISYSKVVSTRHILQIWNWDSEWHS